MKGIVPYLNFAGNGTEALQFYCKALDGKILLDGHDLKALSLESLRKNISLVLQDALIFPISLKDNIAFGDQRASFDAIVAAAKMAHVIDQKRRYVILPWQMALVGRFMKLLPAWVWDWAMKNAPHKARTDWDWL